MVSMNRYEHNSSCSEPILLIRSAAHVAHAFVNDTYVGKYLQALLTNKS